MEILKLEKGNLAECVERAAEVLRAGGVIIYPTDTLYGLGGDALSDNAFATVCLVKDRDERRPIHAIFADLSAALEYVELTPMGKKLADEFLPGPLTLVFKKKEGIATGIAYKLPTIGVRIPKNEFCLALAKAFGKPYTTTSANKSGEETLSTIDAILKQLGDKARYVDLAIDAGPLPPYARSTVVDVRDGNPFILREGAIPAADIWDTLRSEY